MTATDLEIFSPPAAPLALVEPPALSVSMLPVPQMRAVLAEYDARRNAFREWLLSHMKEGVHYGIPPGCEPKMRRDGTPEVNPEQWLGRPSLYKAGAELACDLVQLDPTFEPDLDAWKMLGAAAGTVVIRCRLLSRGDSPFFPNRAKGEVVGEGRGAGIAGKKGRDGNGAMKIASKSAKIDAVINTLNLSDLFTQDLEDQTPRGPAADADRNAPQVGTRAERAAEPDGPPVVTADQLRDLYRKWRDKMKPAGDMESLALQFSTWAQIVLVSDAPPELKPSAWSVDALDACRQELEAIK